MSAARRSVEIADLPGGARVLQGLRDIEAGRDTDDVLWLQMASGRLRENEVEVEAGAADVHVQLFRRCVAADPMCGHATYRALNEELSSFLDALEDRRRRRRLPESRHGLAK